MSALRNKILGATLALSTAFGSIATQAAAEQDNTRLAATETYETVDLDTAKAKTQGGKIVLYFGEGINPLAITALRNIIAEDKQYEVLGFHGAENGKIKVCFDQLGCYNEDFTIENSGDILGLVDAFGPLMKQKITENLNAQPKPAA